MVVPTLGNATAPASKAVKPPSPPPSPRGAGSVKAPLMPIPEDIVGVKVRCACAG